MTLSATQKFFYIFHHEKLRHEFRNKITNFRNELVSGVITKMVARDLLTKAGAGRTRDQNVKFFRGEAESCAIGPGRQGADVGIERTDADVCFIRLVALEVNRP